MYRGVSFLVQVGPPVRFYIYNVIRGKLMQDCVRTILEHDKV